MSPQNNIIELLYWIRARGFQPRTPRAKDRFLCPMTNRISQYRDLQEHQRRFALWIPSVKGLKKLGLAPKMTPIGTIMTAKVNRFEGAGPGEEEALLSLMQNMRNTRAA